MPGRSQNPLRSHRGRRSALRQRRPIDLLEPLEPRLLLTAIAATTDILTPSTNTTTYLLTPPTNAATIESPTYKLFRPAGAASPLASSSSASGYTPTQIATAYGFNLIMFGAITGNGAGQTIALVDAYDDPDLVNSSSANFNSSDLHLFDVAMHLPDPPSFTKVGQTGSTTSLPNSAPTTSGNQWALEISLDVEWAHALAPQANILLVEANSASNGNLYAAVNTARNYAGVSVVSMSWGGSEASNESSDDSYFTTPSGHIGVTFIASAGDTGSPAEYPAASPNVLSVGGTSLTLNASNNWSQETVWNNSYGSTGGGPSAYESQPSYQTGVVTQTSTKRATPDVAFDADPNTGVPIYDSYDGSSSDPWFEIGGTSLSAPCWAALIAIIDQGRALSSLASLNGPSQTLPDLYALPASDFHDITSGTNGTYSAGPGYDYDSGRGSPIANLITEAFVGTPSATPGIPVLAAVSDTGYANSDDITRLNNNDAANELQFSVSNTVADATITLLADGTNVIATTTATGTTTTLTTNGAFTLSDGSHTITASQTQPGDSAALSAPLTITIDTTPPAVTATTPSGPVNSAQSDLKFTFTEALDPGSFTIASDVTSFTGPAGSLLNQITGFAWSSGNTVLDITFNSQTALGVYQMIIGPQIPDLAGNPMAAPYTASFSIASPAPATPALLASSDTGASDSDDLTNLNNSSPANALQFLVTGTIAGAAVTLYADGTNILGTATADGFLPHHHHQRRLSPDRRRRPHHRPANHPGRAPVTRFPGPLHYHRHHAPHRRLHQPHRHRHHPPIQPSVHLLRNHGPRHLLPRHRHPNLHRPLRQPRHRHHRLRLVRQQHHPHHPVPLPNHPRTLPTRPCPPPLR